MNGGVRDAGGFSEIKGIRVYVRWFHPSAIADVMLMGITVPIRIGTNTVMSGDVILSDPEGLTFVPPHLAEQIADKSELARSMDEWGHKMLREGRYTPGHIDDSHWTKTMIDEFNQYAEQQGSRVRRQAE